jgi:hypothetical protein
VIGRSRKKALTSFYKARDYAPRNDYASVMHLEIRFTCCSVHHNVEKEVGHL